MAVKVSLAAAVIGLIYGYDTGNIAGVLLFVPDYFHLGTSKTSSLTTVVVAGMIVGAAVASRLADRFGRKPTHGRHLLRGFRGPVGCRDDVLARHAA